VDSHIDWLSFTAKVETPVRSPQQLLIIARYAIRELGYETYQYVFERSDYDHVVGRAPYMFALADRDRGIRLYGGGHSATILCEISGKGCDGLRDEAVARAMLGEIHGRCTRLDYAVDIRTRVLPVDFASRRDAGRFRSFSLIDTGSGQTVYLGSPRSDRFARVYRYHHPHPRHQLLRAEFVFRRDLAKVACEALADKESAAAFTDQCGNVFGLRHSAWKPSVLTNEKLPTAERSKSDSQTLNWLYVQVAPALRRLMREDAINMTDWLEFVYSQRE